MVTHTTALAAVAAEDKKESGVGKAPLTAADTTVLAAVATEQKTSSTKCKVQMAAAQDTPTKMMVPLLTQKRINEMFKLACQDKKVSM